MEDRGTRSVWSRIRDAWWVIAAAVVLGFAAPQKTEAPDTAQANAPAVDRLHRTVRIVACSREELDTTARMRLDCAEFH